MKRFRDDEYPCPQFKRCFGSSRYDQSQVSEGGADSGEGAGDGNGGDDASQKLTTHDAMAYLKAVKEMFQDQREKYDMFLEVMKDFKAKRTDTVGVIARVKELFTGHDNLILGFNTFLPKGYEITLDEDESPTKKSVEFHEAINFVNKIRRRFQNDGHTYKSFLDILNMYRKEHKDINEVYTEVTALLGDHPDLLGEFRRFLPVSSATNVTHNVIYNRNSSQISGERNSAKLASRPMHMDKHRNRTHRIAGYDRDPSLDRPNDSDDKALLKVQKDQRKHTNKDSSCNKRNVEGEDREPEHEHRDFCSHRVQEKRRHTRKVEGFRERPDLPFDDQKDAVNGLYSEGVLFCEKVKEKLCSADDYQAFLKLLDIYSNGIIKRNDLQILVTDLLGKRADLTNEFNEFLERCENIDGFLAGVMNKKSFSNNSHLHKSSKVDRKHESEGKKDMIRSDYLLKSIQELDLSDCQRCTPSYRLLPDDYPIPSASQRSELGAQVLNDHWVSVTSGSEDYSFKHMRRNQYEESLFRCEDDRFELDMLIESVISTCKRVEELLNCSNENKSNFEIPFRVEIHFNALYLRCIERLYGDHGLDVMDILRKNPNVALPVILTRLKQKREEWTKCRSDFNKVWADVYAKNHYKSLDHRSFYFKQQDFKNLSAKSLIAEIKEMNEKHHKEDDLLKAIASRSRSVCFAQLEFSYSDKGIHEDLYKIFQYSCEEVCSTKEQLNKVLRLWTSFLEPLLGIPSRTHDKGIIEVGNVSHGMVYSSTLVGKNENRGSPDVTITSSNLKQLKSENDRDQNLSKLLINGDISVTERTSTEFGHASKDVTSSNAHFREKELKVCSITPAELNVPPVAVKNSNVDTTNEISLLAAKPSLVGKSLETSHKNNNEVDGKNDKSAAPSKAEKEEGELSPMGEFEENFMDCKEDNVKSMLDSEHEQENRSTNEDGGGGNGAEADDEDSQNLSDRGGEVSGSDMCSHDDEEEEEEVDCDEAETRAESEGELDGHCGMENGIILPLPDRHLSLAKPLSKRIQADQLDGKRDLSSIFYANDDFYVLLRLYQTFYERILSAKTNLGGTGKPRNSEETSYLDPYNRFMKALYNLLHGTIDNSKFEDECRAIIGNQSYILFTLDKLIYKLVKQLQLVATDEMDSKLLQLYEYEKGRKHKFIDSVYYENVRMFLHEENIYRMKFSMDPPRLSIQLMDNVRENPDVFAVSVEPNFGAYLLNDFLRSSPSGNEPTNIFLRRNKKIYSLMDENSATCSALEEVHLFNGLEYKINCISKKISYVFDTEDFFFRPRRKRRHIYQEREALVSKPTKS
ncbi:hypothetical protein SAY86_013534 [Trapa natans]|uniref:Histone deacetylase interacting domain-containing protein n=1 Tax=Trapa natans TaxID=22666 RepID=A0AAN7KSJ3_TRANT|nr:hypothetical protein SAY86_013534 [Trapa natans]